MGQKERKLGERREVKGGGQRAGWPLTQSRNSPSVSSAVQIYMDDMQLPLLNILVYVHSSRGGGMQEYHRRGEEGEGSV